MAVSNPPTFGAASNPAAGSVRKEFEPLGSSTSLYAYRRGGGIIPDTSYYSGVGLGTTESPLKLTQFAGLTVGVNFQSKIDGYAGNGAMAPDSAGNVYLAAAKYDSALNYIDFNIIKLNPAGGVIWKKSYSSISSPLGVNATKIIVDNSDNVYIVGMSISQVGTSVYKLVYMKINTTNGNVIWSKFVATDGTDNMLTPLDAKLDPTGQYVYIVGRDGVGVLSNTQGFICKFDLNGNLIWSKAMHSGYAYYAQQQYPPYQYQWWYNNVVPDWHLSIDFDTVNNRIVCGQVVNSSPGIMVYDYDGNGIWSYVYSATTAIQRTGGTAVALGSYYYLVAMLGYQNSDTDSNVYPHLIKINTDGSINSLLYRLTTSGSTTPTIADDGTYIYTYINGILVVKSNTSGGIIWQREYGTTLNSGPLQIKNDKYYLDKSYVIQGFYGGSNTAIQEYNKFPIDGSGTGTHGVFSYSAGTGSFDTAPTLTGPFVYWSTPIVKSWAATAGDITLTGDSSLTLILETF